MKLNIEIIEKLLEKHGSYLDGYAADYSEPGYSKTNDGYILFADWNDVPKHIMAWIEKHHNIEWSDEWFYNCTECGNAVRTQPDCWAWTQSFHIFNECEPVCHDCIESNPDLQKAILDELIDNPKRCNLLVDLEKFGFTEIECGFESGWHPGQTDDPKKILDAAQKAMPDMQFVFGDIAVGQFDVSFCLYARKAKKE
jgi:hypothetical protein